MGHRCGSLARHGRSPRGVRFGPRHHAYGGDGRVDRGTLHGAHRRAESGRGSDSGGAAQQAALPPDASGEQIYRAACAVCHGLDGTGATRSVVGFELPLPNGHDFPDFTDCATNTVEPLSDWIAVAARGGPVRALDRHMPAFGEALSAEQLDRVVRHLWTFCTDASWPRGDLNLPRAFFTEKAFPENETVWTTGVTGSGQKAVANELVYEHRIGARGQYEVKVPFTVQQGDAGGWNRGIGDVEVAVRRTLYASHERGSIFAAGGAVTFPTGKESVGLGNGYTVVEPFAMWGQITRRQRFPPAALGARDSRPIRTRGGTKASSARRSATRSPRMAVSDAPGRR